MGVNFQYLGTCITTVDEDQIWDATEMAYLIENSDPFDKVKLVPYLDEELKKMVISDDSDRFYSGQKYNIVWLHDDEIDIHYFYNMIT
jgi:hypothetical protein